MSLRGGIHSRCLLQKRSVTFSNFYFIDICLIYEVRLHRGISKMTYNSRSITSQRLYSEPRDDPSNVFLEKSQSGLTRKYKRGLDSRR
jgi:hypothetical protein